MEKTKRSHFSILLVDDTPELLDIHSKMLRKAGYKVLTAVNGSECRFSMFKEKPDILLLDIILPDINGKDLCREFKNDPEFSSVYLILLSSYETSDKEILAGLDYGADTYITRPIKNREFLLRIDAACRTMIAERELKASLLAWETTFNAIKDAIFIIDADCNIVRVNKSTEKILNKKESGLLGHKCYEVVHCADENIENCPFISANITKTRESLNLQLGEKWVECGIDPIFDNKGKMVSAVHFIKDITENKVSEIALKKKNLELEQFNNVMLGREIKMIELKKEINVLLKKAGENEKYKIHE